MQTACYYRRESFYIVHVPFPLVHLHIIIWKERGEISDIYFLYTIYLLIFQQTPVKMNQETITKNHLCYDVKSDMFRL